MINIAKPRIISLLPSATEIVCALGLQEFLIGVSHSCDFPEAVNGLPKVTSDLVPDTLPSGEIDRQIRERVHKSLPLYRLDEQLVEELAPTMIVTQDICNVCAVSDDQVQRGIQHLNTQPKVLTLSPTNLDDVLRSLVDVGQAAERLEQAVQAKNALEQRIEIVRKQSTQIQERKKILFLEWIDPPFSAGHWTPEIIQFAGASDLVGVPARRSRTLTWEEISQQQPDCVVIACCGFGIARTQLEMKCLKENPVWQGLQCVQEKQVFILDGSQYFNRPGPRLVDSLELLAWVLYPDHHHRPEWARSDDVGRLDV